MATRKNINTYISGEGSPNFEANFGWTYEDTNSGKRYEQRGKPRGKLWRPLKINPQIKAEITNDIIDNNFITSVTDTSTVDLDVTANVLTADFVSMNISQFTNDVPYLTTALAAATYVPYTGAIADLDMGSKDIYGGLIHAHRAFELGDTLADHHLHLVLNENMTADHQLDILVNDADRSLTIAGNTSISGTNTGDQTSIVGISGTMAQFDTACSDGNFVYESDLAAGIATWLATPSSANLAAAVTDETGTGLLVFNNSPTFIDDITVGTAATATGQILLRGTTSGTVTFSVADAAGTWTMKLPTTDGNAGEFLQTDGSGNTTWAAGGAGANTALSNLAAVAINTSLLPGVDDTIDLGSAAKQWNALYLGDGGFIGWGGAINGSIQVSGTAMNFANSTEYNFDAVVRPSANNTIPLGTAVTNEWSDLFLGEGGVINWDNGDATLTQVGDVLTLAGADLKITSAGNAATSALTTSAVQTITGVKTFNDDTLELNNPGGTFQYIFSTSAITADRILTFPIFHQDERIGVEAYTGQTTADRTSTSTSLADVTDLAAFSTAANTKYYFDFQLSVTTNATTVGILLSVNHSTAITSIIFNIMYPISATASNVQQNLTTLDGGVQPTAGNGATIQPARVWGIVTTNTAGTLALRFASETGAAVTVKAGSTGIISRVN